MELKIMKKNVWGNELNYPACAKSNKFIDLLNCKTFTSRQLIKIKSLGYRIVYV